jgi:hypothetical protein
MRPVVGLGPVPVQVVRDIMEGGSPFLKAVLTKGKDIVGVAHLGRRHHALKTHEGWSLVEGRGKRAFVPPGDPRHPGPPLAEPQCGGGGRATSASPRVELPAQGQAGAAKRLRQNSSTLAAAETFSDST